MATDLPSPLSSDQLFPRTHTRCQDSHTRSPDNHTLHKNGHTLHQDGHTLCGEGLCGDAGYAKVVCNDTLRTDTLLGDPLNGERGVRGTEPFFDTRQIEARETRTASGDDSASSGISCTNANGEFFAPPGYVDDQFLLLMGATTGCIDPNAAAIAPVSTEGVRLVYRKKGLSALARAIHVVLRLALLNGVDLAVHGTVLGLTVHRPSTSEFLSLVLELNVCTSTCTVERAHSGCAFEVRCKVGGERLYVWPRVFSHYPSIECSKCKTVQVQDGLWVSWDAELPAIPPALADMLTVRGLEKENSEFDVTWAPFCCRGVTKVHDRRLQRDSTFAALVAHKGTNANIVYEVKAMRNRADAFVFSRRFYTLLNGTVSETQGVFTRRIHAYKNYWCRQHDLWFSIDLFAQLDDSTESARQKHHMRMCFYSNFDNSTFVDELHRTHF